MSSNASLTANRSARARALGRSMSQMAATSIDLSFRSTGRWATWVMAPPPTTPTRRRSDAVRLTVMRPPSVQALQLGAGVVRRDDLAVVLARTRAAHRSPLAEPAAVYQIGRA